MIADKLSKLGQTIQTEWPLYAEVSQAICSRWHQLQADLFATTFYNNSHSWCHRSQTPRHGQCTHSALPGRTCTHTPFHLQPSWASGGKVAGLPLQQDNTDCPRVAQHALVLGSSGNVQSDPTMSAQHTQPGVSTIHQVLHRNLSNLFLQAGLLERQESRSRASLRQWQHDLRLLKEDQPDLSMRPSGPFLTKWYLSNQVDFRAPPLKDIADFLLYLFQDKRGHGGRVVTLSPPTSAAGVRSPSWP